MKPEESLLEDSVSCRILWFPLLCERMWPLQLSINCSPDFFFGGEVPPSVATGGNSTRGVPIPAAFCSTGAVLTSSSRSQGEDSAKALRGDSCVENMGLVSAKGLKHSTTSGLRWQNRPTGPPTKLSAEGRREPSHLGFSNTTR